MKKRKKILLWIFIPIIALILLLAALFIVIQNPKVQTRIAQIVTNKLSKQLDTKVTIGGVDIDFFTQLSIDDFYVEDKAGDTLLYAGNIYSKAITFSPLKNTFLLSDSKMTDVKVRINRGETDSLSNLDLLFLDQENEGEQKKSKRKKKSLNLSFKNALIENFDFQLRDSLKNQSNTILLPRMYVDFNRFSIGKKIINAEILEMDEPYIALEKMQYTNEENTDTSRFALPEGWYFRVGELDIQEAHFVNRGSQKVSGKEDIFSFGNFSMDPLSIHANEVIGEKDSLTFDIEKLSFKDETGFEISELTAEAWFSSTQLGFNQLNLVTPGSNINGDALFKFNYLSDFSNFEEEINLDLNLVDVKLVPEDMTYLFGKSPVSEPIFIKGEGFGRLNNLSTENFELRFQHGSVLKGDIDARGLPDLENTFFDAKIDQLSTTQAGIRKISGKQLSEKITRFGDISYQGEFLGYLSELVSFGTINTDIGSFETDVKFSNENSVSTYSGYLSSNNFDIGYWLDNEDLGLINFSGNVSGTQFDLARMISDINVDIESIEFKNNTYQNISIDGGIENQIASALIDTQDPSVNGVIDANIDFSNPVSKINFTSNIEKADLNQLGIMKDSMIVSGEISASLVGNNFDEMFGEINAQNASIITSNKLINLETVSVKLEEIEGQESITVATNTATASLIGDYTYSQLLPTFQKTMNSYYDFGRGWDTLGNTIETNQTIGFELDVSEEDELLELFVNGLDVTSDIQLEGSINPATGELSVVGDSESIGWKNFAIRNWTLDAIGTGKILVVNSFQDELYNNGKKWLVNSEVNFEFSGDEILADIRTYNDSFLAAKLTTRLIKNDDIFNLSILSSDLVINGEEWDIDENNSLTFGGGTWKAENFILTNHPQKIEIYNPPGSLDTKLITLIENIELEDINQLIGFTQKPFEGQMSGEISLVELGEGQTFDVSLITNKFMYNNDIVDVVTIDGLFNLDRKTGNFDGILSDPDFQGGLTVDLDLNKSQDILDINVELYRASLTPFQNLWSDSIEDLNGYATGFMNIAGGPETFNLDGDINLTEDLSLTLKFTQARYTVKAGQQINITRNRFDFNNLEIYDPYGSVAQVSGAITHQDLTNFQLNIQGSYSNFLFLNTDESDNPVFYGTAYADGTLSFTGPVNDAVMQVNATSMPGTEIHIGAASSAQTTEYNFIRFRKPKIDSVIQAIEERNESVLTMLFDLDINQNAELHMSFDDQDYNTLRANGFGNLSIDFNTQDLLEIEGFYQVVQGAYIMDFAGIRRDFQILPGGTIRWSGDPYNALLDIDARYTLNADTRALLQGTSAEETRSPKVETQINVNLSETLAVPKFSYKIDILSANTGGNISEQLRLINNNNTLLDKQLVSLLVLRQFTNNNSSPFASQQSIGTIAFNSVSAVISRQISALINEVGALENTQIGLELENFRENLASNPESIPGGLDQQVQLRWQQQLGKYVRIRSGVELNYGEYLDTERNNVFNVGDIILDFDIDKDGRYEVTLFSKYDYNILNPGNENDRRNGIGYIFQRDFDDLDDLFRRKKEVADTIEDDQLQELDEDSTNLFPENNPQNNQEEQRDQQSNPVPGDLKEIDEDSPRLENR